MANQKTAQVLKIECNGQFYRCIKKIGQHMNPYVLYRIVYTMDKYGYPRKHCVKLAEYANFASIIAHLNEVSYNTTDWH